MILDAPAYPSVDDTRGTNFPDVWHPGLNKRELFLAHAVQGALASGANAEDAALTAWEAVEALESLANPSARKGASSASKTSGSIKQGSKDTSR